MSDPTDTPQTPTQQTPISGAPLPATAVQRGLRLSIIEGALTAPYLTVTAGALLTGIALSLGATPLEIGIIGALPFVSQMFQFVGAYLEERLGERRRLAAWTAAISRSFWVVIVALPFLNSIGGARLPIFLAALVLSQAFIGIAANAWTSWMTDLVPSRQRGRYFGLRNTIVSVVAMAAGWGSGRAFDAFRIANQEALGYAIIFGLAAALGIASAGVLFLQPEPPMRRRERLRISELFSAPLHHPRFRNLSFTATGWAIATGIAGPFFNAYGIQNLGLSFADLALFGVLTSAVSLISQPLIGRLQDRYGDRRVLILSTLGVVLLPWGWVLARPDFLIPLYLTSAFAGVFWPGITQGQLNLVMDRAPAEGRGAYLAFFGAATGIGTFLAGLLGGMIASALAQTQLSLGPLLLDRYTILFVASSIGRFIMAIVFARRLA